MTNKKPKQSQPQAPTYIAVLPYMHRPYFDACMATCELDVFPVDNTVENVGCTVGWNMGLKRTMDKKRDWCIIVSAACRFGEQGGLDFVEALAANADAHVIQSQSRGHFFAVRRSVIECVGYCDENFFPSYWQDGDWELRWHLGFGADFRMRHVRVGVRSESVAHGIELAKLHVNFVELQAYYTRKWGTPVGSAWEHPFNDPTKPISWWPPPGHPLALPRPRLGQFIEVEGR